MNNSNNTFFFKLTVLQNLATFKVFYQKKAIEYISQISPTNPCLRMSKRRADSSTLFQGITDPHMQCALPDDSKI